MPRIFRLGRGTKSQYSASRNAALGWPVAMLEGTDVLLQVSVSDCFGMALEMLPIVSTKKSRRCKHCNTYRMNNYLSVFK